MQNQRTQQIVADRVEFFKTSVERGVGLLKYQEAPKKLAAVFILPLFGLFPVIHTFGMHFSIDVVYCNRDQVVISIHRSVSPNRLVIPWRYLLSGCRYIIEFSSSMTNELKIGDRLVWSAS